MTPAKKLGSVIIPAHDEAGVIMRSLDALFSGMKADELEVIVVCNGCNDDTASRVRASDHAVRVIELPEPSKPMALRAGDAAAVAFPRLYLDADVVLPGTAARQVLDRLRRGAIAARPPICFDSSRSSLAVRRYYRARSRVPAVMSSLWGAGVCGVSADGRRRFGAFPDLVADDLWLDRQFAPGEVEIVDCPPVVVAVPRRTRDLVRVLRRTYRGKSENRAVGDAHPLAHETMPSTLRDLGRLASQGPVAAIDAAVYVAFAAGARLMLRLSSAPVPGAGASWERDVSSRTSP